MLPGCCDGIREGAESPVTFAVGVWACPVPFQDRGYTSVHCTCNGVILELHRGMNPCFTSASPKHCFTQRQSGAQATWPPSGLWVLFCRAEAAGHGKASQNCKRKAFLFLLFLSKHQWGKTVPKVQLQMYSHRAEQEDINHAPSGMRPGFLNHGTGDIWACSSWGTVLCIVGCSADSPSPPHGVPQSSLWLRSMGSAGYSTTKCKLNDL